MSQIDTFNADDSLDVETEENFDDAVSVDSPAEAVQITRCPFDSIAGRSYPSKAKDPMPDVAEVDVKRDETVDRMLKILEGMGGGGVFSKIDEAYKKEYGGWLTGEERARLAEFQKKGRRPKSMGIDDFSQFLEESSGREIRCANLGKGYGVSLSLHQRPSAGEGPMASASSLKETVTKQRFNKEPTEKPRTERPDQTELVKRLVKILEGMGGGGVLLEVGKAYQKRYGGDRWNGPERARLAGMRDRPNLAIPMFCRFLEDSSGGEIRCSNIGNGPRKASLSLHQTSSVGVSAETASAGHQKADPIKVAEARKRVLDIIERYMEEQEKKSAREEEEKTPRPLPSQPVMDTPSVRGRTDFLISPLPCSFF